MFWVAIAIFHQNYDPQLVIEVHTVSWILIAELFINSGKFAHQKKRRKLHKSAPWTKKCNSAPYCHLRDKSFRDPHPSISSCHCFMSALLFCHPIYCLPKTGALKELWAWHALPCNSVLIKGLFCMSMTITVAHAIDSYESQPLLPLSKFSTLMKRQICTRSQFCIFFLLSVW